MSVVRGGFVTIDCADPEPVARFWAELLDGEVVASTERFVMVRSELFLLVALRVEDHVPPTWPSNEVPKQVHLDLAVDDLDEAVAEAVRLGASVAEHQPGPDRWRVLFDPAGHPFCFTTQVPARLLRPG